MNAPAFSIAHIGAVQRQWLDEEVSVLPLAALTAEPVKLDKLWCVVSVPKVDPLSGLALRRRLMTDTLSGFGGASERLVFVTVGQGASAISAYGTDKGPAASARLAATLSANHPGIDLTETTLEAILPPGLVAGGLLVGTPAPVWPEAADDPTSIDRFIRGMREADSASQPEPPRWAFIVVAERIAPAEVAKRLSTVLSELRTVADQDRGNQPIAAHYVGLLGALAQKITRGRATSLWNVSLTIAANGPAQLARALGLARSVFAGEASNPDPVRALPIDTPPPLPCRYDAPPRNDTAVNFFPGLVNSLLSADELAGLVAVPQLERVGFEVRTAPRFKQATRPAKTPLQLGEILERGQSAGVDYTLDLTRLTSHALIAGASGSGKTNTVFHMLRQVVRAGIPFLVIEPTKTEYRALTEDPEFGAELAVFTLGDETVSPLRINPFEVPEGALVQTHLDRLKAVFNASFSMWAPMPQVLERCLIEIYEECGYDLATGLNARGEGIRAMPVLGALQGKIEMVVSSLGYDRRVTDDVSAALRTRIDSLRVGAKGLMLDVVIALDVGALLARPTVLELDAIGDDDEKAFLVGLIFSRIAADMSRRGPSGGKLRHLTVIEEAHRLFTDVPLVAGSEIGNPKGKAVETFCNILSEIRAYGAGMLIVDQIPTRLARDTIKNTALKIMHRLPAEDDREAMGRAMVQSSAEIAFGAALPVGVALVNTGGENGSFEVRVPRAPFLATEVSRAEADKRLRAREGRIEPGTGPSQRQVQMLMRRPDLADETFRYLQSLAVVPGPSYDVLVPLLQAIARHRPPSHREALVMTLRAMLVTALGDAANSGKWSFEVHDAVESALLDAYDVIVTRLVAKEPPQDNGAAFRAVWDMAGTVDIYPFPQFAVVAPDFICRYNHVARRLAETDPLRTTFAKTLAETSGDALWPALVTVTERAVARGLSDGASQEQRGALAGCFILYSLDLARELELSQRDKVFRNVFGFLSEGRDRSQAEVGS